MKYRTPLLSLLLIPYLHGCLLVGFEDDVDASLQGPGLDGTSGGGDGDGDGDAASGTGTGGQKDDGATGGMPGDGPGDAGTGGDAAMADAAMADAAMACDLAEPECQTCTPDSIVCVGDTAVVCDSAGMVQARVACHDKPVDMCQVARCTPDVGCEAVPVEGEPVCGEGRFCFGPGVCQEGTCADAEPRDCSELDGLCVLGACNEGEGRCEAVPAREGEQCEGDLTCQAGVCGGPPG